MTGIGAGPHKTFSLTTQEKCSKQNPALESLGNLLKMQVLGPHIHPQDYSLVWPGSVIIFQDGKFGDF
jgi:hypothetical protein